MLFMKRYLDKKIFFYTQHAIMKEIKILALSAVLVFTGLAVKAQHFEGGATFAFLIGQTKLNVEYNYDSMMVGDKTEEQYIKEKKAIYEEREQGRGKLWEENWINARKLIYEPKFEELLNKYLGKGKAGITAGQKVSDAKYTMLVKMVSIDIGFNAIRFSNPSRCLFEITFMETDTKKLVAKGTLKAEGAAGFDVSQSGGMRECYAKAGQLIGRNISKTVGK